MYGLSVTNRPHYSKDVPANGGRIPLIIVYNLRRQAPCYQRDDQLEESETVFSDLWGGSGV